MGRIRTTLRLTLVVSILIAALVSGQAYAQRPGSSSNDDEGTYESELTGLEFTWTDDWELSNADVTGDEEEILELESDLGVLFTGYGLYSDAEEARNDVSGGFESGFDDVEVIDEDVSRGFAWTLVEGISATGDSMFIYIEVEEDVVDDFELITVIVGSEDTFLDQYELVNDTVEMDGDALLGEFDVDEIAELLEGGVAITDEEEATPDTGDDNQSETGRGDDEDASSSAGDSYQFETGDIEVVVGEDVSIDEIQLEEDGYEQVLLIGVGSIGAVSLVQSPFDAEQTLEGFMGGFLQEMDDSRELEVVTEGGIAWGLYEANVGGMDMYIYAVVNDDLYEGHYLELVAAPADFFEDEFVAFQESVQVNETGMFDGIDVDDLLAIIEGS